MAGAVWDALLRQGGADSLAEQAGLGPDDLRESVCFWGGLHDVGKISPDFQQKVPRLYQQLSQADPSYSTMAYERPEIHHSEASQWALTPLLVELGYATGKSARRHAAHQVAQMLGGHHGHFWPAMGRGELAQPRRVRPRLGTGVWEEQCHRHVSVLHRLTGANPLTRMLPTTVSVQISGLIVVADWLASQEPFISARQPPDHWDPTFAELEAHWERAAADAPKLVRDAGLGQARWVEGVSFGKRFGFEPNPLQASLAAELPSLVKGPGLLLVTAPAGDGKTEAALEAANLMAKASRAAGMGFSLPTMATADAMYERVKTYAHRALEEDASLTRVHSMAWLAEESDGEAAAKVAGAGRTVSDEDSSVEASTWLHGTRRGLLAPLSVFTIDQGLTAVLPVRHNALRLLALSRKVLVVDEAHAYGPWMHALLIRLLEWLGALGAPVVVLSATLTGKVSRSLVAAYLRGCQPHAEALPAADAHEISYPRWLWAGADGTVSRPRSVRSQRQHRLRIRSEPVRRGVAVSEPEHRSAVIKRLLEPAVSGGGCVLVCCTTVAEAQETWRELREWFQAREAEGERVPQLHLLHSRYRAADRARLTKSCESAFRKEGPRPPEGAVLVATQVVEQSLDLDFDLVVSDLAPMAQLLQRAGRCQRHRLHEEVPDPHASLRPAWIAADSPGGEHVVDMVVLDPVGEDGTFERPACWGAVYDEGLLRRTSALLAGQAGGTVRVPEDVQGLVEAVYAEDFARLTGMSEAEERALVTVDAERLADEATEAQLAAMVRIPAPADLGNDLHRLSVTSVPVDESLIATRLGADSARLVCVYEQPGSRWTLDEAGSVPVPGLDDRAVVTAAAARTIAASVIPVPGSWVGEGAELMDLPDAWRANSTLRGWSLLPMKRDSEGRWRGRLRPGLVGYGHSGLLPMSDSAEG